MTASDIGGRDGFGAVLPEPNEPVFHFDWERRALGLTLAAGALGAWTIDESRHARESLRSDDYLSSSYYEIWTKGLERLLVRHGLVTTSELDQRAATIDAPRTPRPPLRAADVPGVLTRSSSYARDVEHRARFAVGDSVRGVAAKRWTHAPSGYAEGHVGCVEVVRGAHVFPDTNAHGDDEQPTWLYTVTFDGRELWGGDSDPAVRVSIDAWEPYLDHA